MGKIIRYTTICIVWSSVWKPRWETTPPNISYATMDIIWIRKPEQTAFRSIDVVNTLDLVRGFSASLDFHCCLHSRRNAIGRAGWPAWRINNTDGQSSIGHQHLLEKNTRPWSHRYNCSELYLMPAIEHILIHVAFDANLIIFGIEAFFSHVVSWTY